MAEPAYAQTFVAQAGTWCVNVFSPITSLIILGLRKQSVRGDEEERDEEERDEEERRMAGICRNHVDGG